MALAVNFCIRWFFEGVYSFIWFIILYKTLTPRYSFKKIITIQFIWFFAHMTINRMLPFMSSVRTVLFLIIFVFICLACYKDSWPKTVFSVTMIFMVLITNEIIGVGLYFPPEVLNNAQETMPAPQLIQFWITYDASAAVLYFLLYLFLNRQKYSLSAADWSMFALFPASQYVLMYGWLDSLRQSGGSSGRSLFFGVVLCACIISDLGLFAAIMRIAQRSQLAAENSLLSAQVAAQEKHYQDLTAQYESIRRMRHDIANHLSAMESLLASGRSSEAQEYLQELNSVPIDSTLGMCEHPVVDAFLHNKICTARSSGIEVDAKIDLPAGIPISNADLIRIFGNLVDNAVEACSNIQNPKIELNCCRAHGCLIISTINPAPQNKSSKSRRIPGLDRGIGSRVLSYIAEKYNGSLNFDESNGLFTTELILTTGRD